MKNHQYAILSSFRLLIEQLFLLSPFIWLMVGVFSIPGGKSVLSSLIPLVAVYCLVRFKGEWRTNLNNPAFKTFSVANVIIFLFFALHHLLNGEEFGFARTLLTVQLYLTLLPWQRITQRHLWALLILGGIAVGVSALYEVLVLDIPRAGYLAFNPIPYATYAAVLCLSCLVLPLIIRSNLLWTLTSLLGVAGASIAVILSGTRGIWLAIIVIIILVAIQLIRQTSLKKLALVATVSILLLGMSLTAFSNKLTLRYQQTVAEYNHMAHKNMDTSIGIRLQLWQRGLSYIKQGPIWGTGTQQYLANLQQDKAAGLISATAAPLGDAHFHNQFIDTLVRTGGVGLTILLVWMFIPAWSLHKQKHYQQRNWALACGIVMLIGGLTDVPFHHTHLVYFYSMLMGAMLLKTESDKSLTRGHD